MIIKILSCFRKDTSTLLTFCAIVLLLASPLVLSNLLLQPVQAQTTLSFRTPTPAMGYDRPTGQEVALTFDAHGTTSTSDPTRADITNGTIQLQARYTYNGKIISGVIDNRTGVGFISFDATINNTDYSVQSFCSTSQSNDITVKTGGGQTETDFSGPIECSSSQGGDTTSHATQPSSPSSLTGSSQGMDRGSGSSSSNSTYSNSGSSSSNSKDGDRDGIPDSSDNCTHNSYHRCYKEGEASTTTTQQQPSSSNGIGNQTR
jgi:hypothetical protein